LVDNGVIFFLVELDVDGALGMCDRHLLIDDVIFAVDALWEVLIGLIDEQPHKLVDHET
jgi:hypothetical protein